MKNLSDCRVLLMGDAKANLDILVEGLKSDHKLGLARSGEIAGFCARCVPGRETQAPGAVADPLPLAA